jgi:hypothetical protein
MAPLVILCFVLLIAMFIVGGARDLGHESLARWAFGGILLLIGLAAAAAIAYAVYLRSTR